MALQIWSGPHFCEEGDWSIFYYFRSRGGHQTLVSPSSHQDGSSQEQDVRPPARAEILLHLHSLQPDSFREAGRQQYQESK